MTPNRIEKSIATKADMEKINRYSRREMTPDEVYVFNLTLCSNDIDRDKEKFSLDALRELAPLFVGKTGISDHSMKSSDQRARIFDTNIEKLHGRKTADGEEMYCLTARAYMLDNEENRSFIDDIEAGIKKEVSVSCSMGSCKCSVCGSDRRTAPCRHRKGSTYSGQLCYDILSDAKDAYEFSFVAVPAQRDAGITKAFGLEKKGESDMDDIIKSIRDCDGDCTVSKSQTKEILAYIDSLEQDAHLGQEYKKELSKEIVTLFSKAFPGVDKNIFSSVASVMTAAELMGIKNGIKKSSARAGAAPQLTTNSKTNKNDYSEFKI